MRYELKNGYIHKVFFGCHSGTCKLYSGTIPSGYTSLEEWANTANIRAYKIVSGNLTYDSAKDTTLQKEYEELAKTYSTIEKKIGVWHDGKTLYRKTYTNFTYVLGSSVDDIQLETNPSLKVKNSYGAVVLTDNVNNYNVVIPTPDMGFGAFSNMNQNTSGLLYVHRTHGAYATVKDIEITIEYTKTTD